MTVQSALLSFNFTSGASVCGMPQKFAGGSSDAADLTQRLRQYRLAVSLYLRLRIS